MGKTNNIHIFGAAPGEVTKTLAALKASPATARAKEKFALAMDAETLEVEDLTRGELVACARAQQGYDYSPALRATNQQKQLGRLSPGPHGFIGK